MRSVRVLTIFAVLALAATVLVARAQSLADVAKKEEERRKAVSQPAKVYTNKDLSPAPAGSTPPSDKDAKDGGKDAGKDAGKDTKAAADAKDGKTDDAKDTKDQKYWTEKFKQLREQLDRDKTFADAMQNKINSLTTDFVNRDDPAQKRMIEADRQKAIAELGRLTKAIADDAKAISDFSEEARRAGVPAGWLR